MGLSIQQLDLEPDVASKAEELQTACPGVVFTSGRRTIQQQGAAMAQNTLLNRRYIEETYVHTSISVSLQHWLDTNPQAKTLPEITAGLIAVLQKYPLTELQHLSRHISGRAFDVAPNSCSLSALEALHPQQLLTHEGGLSRWHCSW